jgi:hypothetical protein
MRFYRGNAIELRKIFDIQNNLVDAKNMIIKKLQQIRQVTGSFLKTEDGFKITNPEGFWMMSLRVTCQKTVEIKVSSVSSEYRLT